MRHNYKKKLEVNLRRRLLEEIVDDYDREHEPHELERVAEKLSTWTPQDANLESDLEDVIDVLNIDPRRGRNGSWSTMTIKKDIEALRDGNLTSQEERHRAILNRCEELFQIMRVEWEVRAGDLPLSEALEREEHENRLEYGHRQLQEIRDLYEKLRTRLSRVGLLIREERERVSDQ